jgi:hypothetical protein
MDVSSVILDGSIDITQELRSALTIDESSRDRFLIFGTEQASLSLDRKTTDESGVDDELLNEYYIEIKRSTVIIWSGYMDKWSKNYDPKMKRYKLRAISELTRLNEGFTLTITETSLADIMAQVTGLATILTGQSYSYVAPFSGGEALHPGAFIAPLFSVSDNELQDPAKFMINPIPYYYAPSTGGWYIKVEWNQPGVGWTTYYIRNNQNIQNGLQFTGALPGDGYASAPPQVEIPYVGNVFALTFNNGYVYIDDHKGKDYICAYGDGVPWYSFRGATIQYQSASIIDVLSDMAFLTDAVFYCRDNVISIISRENRGSYNLTKNVIDRKNKLEEYDGSTAIDYETAFQVISDSQLYRRFSLEYYYGYKYRNTGVKKVSEVTIIDTTGIVYNIGSALTLNGEDVGIITAVSYTSGKDLVKLTCEAFL